MRAEVYALILALTISGCVDTPVEKLDVKMPTLPYWKSGEQGSASLAPFGGTPPYTCRLKERSALPERFHLSEDCVVSGMASELSSGTTKSVLPEFTVIVSDSGEPEMSIEVKLQIVTVDEFPQIIPLGPSHCKVNKPCLVHVADATDGNPPYTFMSDSYATGAPPMGTAVEMKGWLTGKPSKAGKYTFGVCVKDVIGASDCGQATVIVEDEVTTTKQKRTPTTEPRNGGGCEPGHHPSRCPNGQVRCCADNMECCSGTSCRPRVWC